MKSLIVGCIVWSFTILASCGGKTETVSETEHHHEETTVVSLTNEQLKAAGVVTGNIEMKNLTTSISVNGTLAVPHQNKAFVTSLTGGVLRSLKVQPGDYVRKGAVIGTIANTELSEMQQKLISISGQIQYAEQDLQRQKELVAGNAAPYKNVQKVESELKGLRAQRNALQKQLAAMGISSSDGISSTLALTAPISGTISEIFAQIGSSIDANTPVAEIINNSEIHLDLFIYERDLPKVAPGQIIHFTLTNNPGKEYDATIYSIGTAFANESKAIPIHARVVNDKAGLIEGMSVTARISLGENVYPAVPDEAVVSHGGKDYIFIQTTSDAANDTTEGPHSHNEPHNEPGHTADAVTNFERLQVIKGASDVGYTEIRPIESLPAGTKVVVKGAFFLMAKMTNADEAHDH